MSEQSKPSYQFGPFRVDTAERQLLRDGAPVVLTPKVFDLLLALLERRGHVLEKDALMQRVWPDTIVEENNLTVNISALRKALGGRAGELPYIETVPRRGYRFVSAVKLLEEEDAELVVEKYSALSVTMEEEEVERQGDGATGRRGDEAIGWQANEESNLTSPPCDSPVESRPIAPSPPRRLFRWLLIAAGVAALVVLAAAAVSGRLSRPADPRPGAAVKSIAVLPFKPLTADGRDDSLGLGIADALITRLGNLKQVTVRPTSAVRKYVAQDQEPTSIGRELRVEAVLEGSLQRFDDRIRVRVQLIGVGDGRHLWADQFDEQGTDLFAVQDAISGHLLGALTPGLSGEGPQRLYHPEHSVAHQLSLRSR